ncbi:MAG TPA: TPM domain-containing protein [Bacteroidales bacterium]|nr:TPM domain-containing protein [Bacteroidales bacterium]HRR92529.1 TPM domain-containing protein [Bacteroidales bacterium]HRT89703.1 TPM domain-containing protein [Bacteroidales bacterium]
MKAADFFTPDQKKKIVEAIRQAEKETSGEIRVHIETSCPDDVLDRAAWIFGKLGMHKTRERNGVLFYLAVEDRKFAVIGDSGINALVPEGFWNQVKEIMRKNFTAGRFTEGLTEGITLAGRQLKNFFPLRKNDRNELTDEISFSAGETKENK